MFNQLNSSIVSYFLSKSDSRSNNDNNDVSSKISYMTDTTLQFKQFLTKLFSF